MIHILCTWHSWMQFPSCRDRDCRDALIWAALSAAAVALTRATCHTSAATAVSGVTGCGEPVGWLLITDINETWNNFGGCLYQGKCINNNLPWILVHLHDVHRHNSLPCQNQFLVWDNLWRTAPLSRIILTLLRAARCGCHLKPITNIVNIHQYW